MSKATKLVGNEDTRFGGKRENKRNDGAWKKEDTPRYQMEQALKMLETDLIDIVADHTKPYFQRKMAETMLKGDWKTIEGMVNQVYGYPKTETEVNLNDKKEVILKGFILPGMPDEFKNFDPTKKDVIDVEKE